MENRKRRFPLWMANLFVFAFLFCAVMAYFLWQVQQARKDFLEHVREHAVLVAEVVQLSARGSVLSKRAAEDILEAFLGNTARFVDYLDKVEPFNQEELAAFSKEAGLVGISIQRVGEKIVEGPTGWLGKPPSGCMPASKLEHDPVEHLYLFSLAKEAGPGCVTVGITDTQIRIMQEHLGLENVIRTIAGIPRVSYVELKTPSADRKGFPGEPAVTFIDKGDLRVAEARLPMEGKELTVALDAGYLHLAIGRLWRDFFLFSAALASLGVILSLLLHRYQAAHLMQVQQFERQISSERENASLGRAAAAIAHEIRNPLNALGMGLQRLRMEGEESPDDHRHLVDLMLDSVKRANASVEGLLRYARPQRASKRAMRLDLLAEDMLDLYSAHARELGIYVSRRITFQESMSGDPDLLGQVAENLLKNAIEAQPEGGSIRLTVEKEGEDACFRVRNAGFDLKPEEADRIFDPYFTTKADGTGLGLTISRRIVEAHGGHMEVSVPETGMVEISVCLPAPKSAKRPAGTREPTTGNR
ncbi:MAG TPA: GHKL domain-containing protein [Deltaproteobacteria bacterium]|nr:GHKL domain-containing protein [Deltaproteobacteria bacterium]